MLHQTFLFLGQLWQLFEVSQILEFLRYFDLTLTVIASNVGISLRLMGTALEEASLLVWFLSPWGSAHNRKDLAPFRADSFL